jgi:hypothetical protein
MVLLKKIRYSWNRVYYRTRVQLCVYNTHVMRRSKFMSKFSSGAKHDYRTLPGTCVRRVSLKLHLLSRIALRLLEIIKPYLVEQNRMANAQVLGYGSKHLGQNFFFNWIKKDRSLPEEPERVILKQTPPYNLYGVFPWQPFSTSNGWVTALVKRY